MRDAGTNADLPLSPQPLPLNTPLKNPLRNNRPNKIINVAITIKYASWS